MKDILNPAKWKIFISSKKKDVLGTTFELDDGYAVNIKNGEMQAYIEQIIYRQSFPECGGCKKEGQCTHCGCKSPELFYEGENVCSGGNWGKMLPPEEWREFKEDLGLEIIAEIRKNGRNQ